MTEKKHPGDVSRFICDRRKCTSTRVSKYMPVEWFSIMITPGTGDMFKRTFIVHACRRRCIKSAVRDGVDRMVPTYEWKENGHG